ncbi:MAG: DNA mismatch endonuclease Vsr [Crocinitomicaceae bacterium]|nr:DNA mismatch endonuclease Vsr [Crocinitomicaceae bacterium]
MVDKVSKERRSEIMSSVRGKDTKPELIVRQFLFSEGFKYRLHDKKLPGKPDIKLTKYKTVIFINGCFWHGHTNCKIYVMPKTNKKFWQEKIDKNVARDEKNIAELKSLGWNVILLWECELKKTRRENTFKDLIDKILYPKIL